MAKKQENKRNNGRKRSRNERQTKRQTKTAIKERKDKKGVDKKKKRQRYIQKCKHEAK